MVVRHYMHITKMKKCGFIKNKVVEHIMKMNIEKTTLIARTNVTHGIDDLNEINHAWMVQSQQHLNMTYKVPLLFTKYVCNIKLLFFLHVPFSLKKISFHIVGHGMDLIMEVLLPCLQSLPICTFMTMNLMMKRPMKITLKNHGLLICVSV